MKPARPRQPTVFPGMKDAERLVRQALFDAMLNVGSPAASDHPAPP
jgi:hypothetical protein